jgi:epoxide hydrolase A/B
MRAYRVLSGGLNWYRNINRNWELTAPWSGAVVTPPALYVVSDWDVVYHFPGAGPQMLTNLSRFVPNLKQAVLLEGCGIGRSRNGPTK